MILFTMDSKGKAGHPTRRYQMARKLCKKGKARILGGGLSGKAPILHYLTRIFDPQKTVSRHFYLALDPGFRHTGWVLAEKRHDTLDVLFWGVLSSISYLIKKKLEERRSYRRKRRSHRRQRMKKRSRRLKRNMVKFRAPHWQNRKHSQSRTLDHLLQTHLNLYQRIETLCPLPDSQLIRAFENARFDIRTMLYGKPDTSSDYQRSPIGNDDKKSPREFVVHRDGGCVICGHTKALQSHHVRSRRQEGSDRIQNLLCLCESCHDDVHKGRLSLPLIGVKAHRAASLLNGLCAQLRKKSFLFVPASEVAQHRQVLGLLKGHAVDALSCAAVLANVTQVQWSEAITIDFQQYRRHRRARIHAQRERNYKLGKKVMAQNRHKRCEQKTDSLEEFRRKHPNKVGQLEVQKAKRLRYPPPKDVVAREGELWAYKGKRFVCHGTQNEGRYLYSPDLQELCGRKYISPKECVRILHNEGIVVKNKSEKL